MATTAKLGITLIDGGQAQKHVTVNEAFKAFDALIQLIVINMTTTIPPGNPTEGDVYIPATGATGAWTGWAKKVVAYLDGSWTKFDPQEGWTIYNQDGGGLFVFNGTDWEPYASSFSNLEKIGVNTTADNTNRLAVKSDAVLLSHDDVTPGSGDMRVALNKSAAAKDASFVFQDGFSTRALFGLLGDDNFTVKVSPDGSTFKTAIVIDKSNGHIGINGSPDSNNWLAVNADGILFNKDASGDMRITINKSAAAKDAAFTFQNGFSTRALFGLLGDDDFTVKVSPDGSVFHTAMIAKNADGRVTFPGGITHPDSGQPVALLLPAPVKEVWRIDAARSSTPRTYTIGSVSGSTISLTEARVGEIFTDSMRNVAMVRIWNISKSPAEAAWVNWNNSATQLNVSNAANIATWAPGETIRLGDPNPTGTNTLDMVAIDISNYLFNNFGSVFKQKGLQIAALAQGTGSDVGLDVSGSGAVGTAFGISSLSNGGFNSAPITVFTDQSSPISNSNLLFVRESVRSATALNTVFLRVVGVYV